MKKDYFIFCILIFYFFFQFSTLDYGFKIRDIQYLKNISLNIEDIKSFTQEKTIKSKDNIKNELDSWKYRYKLYSVNADEVLPIMSLSKIDIKKKQYDPQIYKYGGAFIYPLGFYYYFLTKINLIEDINIISITKNEQLIEKIYFDGRLFVLLFFICSAFILYNSLKLLTKKKHALVFTLIYLFVPSSIMYSQIIKPNWYALFWFNLSILFILKYFFKDKKKINLIMSSILLGLTIGSSVIFFPVLIFIYLIIFLNLKNKLDTKFFFFLFCLTLLIFFITNPYILINLPGFINEFSGEHSWVIKGIKFKNIILFFQNSFILGFGLFFSLILFYYLFKTPVISDRKLSLGIFLLILIGAILSGFDDWHIQFRYIPYILPIALLYLAYRIKNYKFILFIFFLTFLQSIPLKLAFYDENSLKFSTRLVSADWINQNIIKKNKSICKKNFAPFNFPPVNFNQIKTSNNCDYKIHILREPKKIKSFETNLIKKFEPRYQFKNFPLVFSHINPLIIIVEN